MNVLVTGGAGFIGCHLVDRLVGQGHQVVAVDNFLTGRYANLAHAESHPSLTIIHHDMIERSSNEILSGPFDRVYNLACPASPRGYGTYPIETLLVNAQGLLNALEIARRDDARFLQTSTSEVYGDPAIHPQTEEYWGHVNPNGPRACYDEGKRYAEALTMEFVRRYGLDARIARIFNTYGPRSHPRDGRAVPNFCLQALQNQPITVYGDGSQTRSLCYVHDLVRGLDLLMETDNLAGRVVNLGNPVETTVIELAEQIVALAGSKSSIVHGRLPQDDPTRRRPDITKAHTLLGWQPEIPLADGLAHTIAYFRAVLETP